MAKNVIIRTTKDGAARPKVAKASQSKQPRAGSSDDTLQNVLGMINTWLDYRAKLLSTWERDTKLYNNERVERHFEGVSDTFVPMTYSTIESISAALLTGDFNTDFVPQDIYKYLQDRLMPGYKGYIVDDQGNRQDESETEYMVRAIREVLKGGSISDQALEVLNSLYDYFWDAGDWEESIGEMIDDGLKIGNGALWMVIEKGKPKLIRVPFPDFVFDPTANEDSSMAFGGRRFLASKKALKAEKIIDPENLDAEGKPKMKKRYDLSGLKKRTGGSRDDRTEKELLEQMLLGSTLTIKDEKGNLKEDLDQCEVIEIMTEDRMYTVINRTCLAEDVENPIVAQAKLRGIDPECLIKIPGIVHKNNGNSSMLVGRSETATFWKEQERLNDATNQKSDAVTRALLQNYRADPALKSQKNSFGIPGAVIWAASNQFESIPPAMVPNVAFTEENSIKNNIREATATDQLIKGVQSTSDVTATEAKLQVAQSGQRIEKKIKQLERGPLKRVARLALQYIRLFITDPFIVPQKVNDGITPLIYDPNKYNYDFEPKVTLTISAQNKRKYDQREAAENYKIIIGDPTNDLEAAKEIIYPKMFDLDKDEIKRIITSPSKPAPASEPQGMLPAGPPQTMPQPVQPEGMPS